MTRIAETFAPLAYDQRDVSPSTRSASQALLVRIMPGLATFAMSILVGRIGGVQTLGEVQLVLSTSMMANLLFPTPAGSIAARFLARAALPSSTHPPASVAQFFLKVTSVAAGVLVMLVVGVQWLGLKADAVIVVMSALMTIAFAARALAEGIHAGLGQMGRLGTWSTLISIASVLGVSILLLLGVRTAALLLPLMIGNLSILLYALPPRSATLAASVRADAFRYVSLGVIGTLASSGLAQAAVLAATLLEGIEYVGTYSAAMTLTTPFAMIASALSLILFPAFARAHSQDQAARLRGVAELATRRLMVGLIAGGLLLAPTAPAIVVTLWGDEFYPAASMVGVLAVAAILNGISVPIVNALTSESARGMTLSVVFSWSGFAVAIGTATALKLSGVPNAIPIAYATGVAVIAALPMIYASTVLRLTLGSVFLKASAGVALILITSVTSISAKPPALLSLGVALILAAAWLAANYRDSLGMARMIVSER
ncbi:hypothetical protein V2S04_06310 [Microbacterium sp. OR21]|uniref:lipopolysaccharide biosynthesis protein n=1 Tax=Microbacterium sp. OR21 TaxID=3095346 RepID=UPI0039B6913C